MDRGYYSKKLLIHLIENNHKFVFRVQYTVALLQFPNKTDSNVVQFRYKKKAYFVRVVKYTINDNEYFLITNLFNVSVDYLKRLYHNRWSIETHFRYCKYNLDMKYIQVKNENNLINEVLIHQFVFIVSNYFQHILQNDIETEHKINTTTFLDNVINEILYLMFYHSSTVKNLNEILRILNILKDIRTDIVPDRSYPKKRISPSTKWCRLGNRFGFCK